MENTIENKTKFFAQYWGQKIFKDGLKRDRIEVISKEIFEPRVNLSTLKLFEIGYLELKPLSSISDEDAIKFLYVIETKEFVDSKIREDKISWGRAFIDSFVKYKLSPQHYAPATDFLRSKGYALPWNGITVEQQIEFGWIKLKE